ncbi:hypothetical protein LTR78_004016 [Recurvomyces mirabilis]|uniref:Uncharacterized protein n=1 Tax=Recurvomyces mirabilis TaxID=574656 RepID=A0AAE0WQZ6_9PEZI|nr:hypothetical protein LTR78_004016 [Recurvomyces mirabilis]KAK5153845.1 hypothetical protein LTS14_007065 [Recurvomyces mirabilis]
MSSPYSNDRSKTCKHETSRRSCLACAAHNTRLDFIEAVTERDKRSGLVQGYEGQLKDPELPLKERKKFEERLEKARKEHVAWSDRHDGLEVDVVAADKLVQAICDENAPEDLAEAFEARAIERVEELRNIWSLVNPTGEKEEESEPYEFVSADPALKLDFNQLDRSSIPATVDTLVTDGPGFEMFLRLGRKNKRLPSKTVGDHDGPAIMSYGAAYDMFGALPGLDAFWVDKDKLEDARLALLEAGEDEGEDEVAEDMAHSDVLVPAPQTELEFRQLDEVHVPTVSRLEEEQQRALFAADKYMQYLSVLARQYHNLWLAQQEAEELEVAKAIFGPKKVEGSADAEPAAIEAPTKAAAVRGSWPPVEGLDFAGFTNWVVACKELDPAFNATLKTWDAQRKARNLRTKELLEQWKQPKDFDSGNARHPSMKDFYNGRVLGTVDLEALGLKKKPKQKQPAGR